MATAVTKHTRMGNRLRIFVVLLLLASTMTHAQIAIYDPAVTFRHRATAALEERLITLQREQRRQLRRMARRLSLWTNLDKYRVTDTPRWRHHVLADPFASLFARDYEAALDYGDATGRAYDVVTTDRDPVPQASNHDVTAAAWEEFAARLATIDVADATTIAATDNAGHVRFNGRNDLRAIDHLEADVVNPSSEESTTAVLEKLSGAALIGARQRQARTVWLLGIVEALLVDSKRARDTDASTLNMQMTTWREASSANRSMVEGTADALRTWRQP